MIKIGEFRGLICTKTKPVKSVLFSSSFRARNCQSRDTNCRQLILKLGLKELKPEPKLSKRRLWSIFFTLWEIIANKGFMNF